MDEHTQAVNNFADAIREQVVAEQARAAELAKLTALMASVEDEIRRIRYDITGSTGRVADRQRRIERRIDALTMAIQSVLSVLPHVLTSKAEALPERLVKQIQDHSHELAELLRVALDHNGEANINISNAGQDIIKRRDDEDQHR